MVEKEVRFFQIPAEIKEFFDEVFELYEIRGGIGEFKGIKFIVHTNDHNPPHVHAKYDKYEISISLLDYSVLVGNLPSKNQNIAIKWVKKNKDYILKYWDDKTLTSHLPLTASQLDSKKLVKI